jgi:hypothetical protein
MKIDEEPHITGISINWKEKAVTVSKGKKFVMKKSMFTKYVIQFLK